MFHLCSLDVNSGNSYNGTYEFAEALDGVYKVSYQHFQTQRIPWVFPGCNVLYVYEAENPSNNSTWTFPIFDSTNPEDVKAWFTAVVSGSGFASVTASEYDSNTKRYTFHFNKTIYFDYTNPLSTIGPVFGWNLDDGFIGSQSDDQLTISSTNMTIDPIILEVHSSDIESECYNVNGDNPSFFIATNYSLIPNQQITISNKDSLNIKIYRQNNHNAAVPLYDHFDIVFKPV